MRRFVQAIATRDALPASLPDVLADALVHGADHYNIAKGKTALVLAINADKKLCVAPMTWGLVPRWSKQASTPYTTVTARLERAPKSRIFSQAWKERPCLVPMTGYYKWDRQRKPAWPHFIQRRDGNALLAAGLWETWEGEDGSFLHSFAILTAPNLVIPPPLTQDGPVFLAMADALAWVRGSITSPRTLLRRADQPQLESYPVSRAIRRVEEEGYTLLEPVDPDDQASFSSGEEDDYDEDE
ncbi:SOS response-associated peptidase [Pseudoxanthomonas mexicana]|uniref:SOS response-associated peptidase n=1 Tax=Pseudoxanthomonas mexicana TaxID=128785 RepID=UPI0009F8F211|nr:SOS response-associated peptidase [Pseudoxanthomonas mexicana]